MKRVSFGLCIVALLVAISLFAHRGYSSPLSVLCALSLLVAGATGAIALAPKRASTGVPWVAAKPGALALGSLALSAGFFLVLRMSTQGRMPNGAAGVLVPTLFLLASASAFALWGTLVAGQWRRAFGPAFVLVTFASLVSLPTLGLFGLTDPWETHYAEVAREILARDDAISTYWANEGWFTSKPILIFWLEAISMALCGVDPAPGAMLTTSNAAAMAHPEWAIRFPHFLLALVGSLVLYAGVARHLGKRRALFGAMLLWAMPQWLLLSRQAITDMALGGGLCACVGLLLLAMDTSEGTEAPSCLVSGVRISSADLLVFVLFMMIIPQAIYLISRNIDLARGFRADQVIEGSAGTCGILPSHPACVTRAPVFRWMTPIAQGATLLGLAGALLSSVSNVHKQRSVYFIAACAAAAVGAMAKGPMALVVPVACVLAAGVATRNVRWLLTQKYGLGLVCAALLILPWYVACYARHSRLFYDELVLRHMLGRTLTHLHDTTEGDDTSLRYYVNQLGFALYPAVALLPGALVHAFRKHTSCARTVLLTWALAVFALVASMGTKFHHYIFPAVPPLAMLMGDYLSALAKQRTRTDVALALFGVAATARITRDLCTMHDGIAGASRVFSLVSYRYDRLWPASLHYERALLVLGILAAVAMLMLVVFPKIGHVFVGVVLVLSALTVSHSYMPAVAAHRGQRELFEQAIREAPDTTPIAYQLNWKGENFYTGNRVAIFISSGAPFQTWLKSQHGTRYFVTEPSRVASLRAELPREASMERITTDAQNSAFTLVRATGL
jgi:4-amino-4-deoxy-L-arabinose transferase-like glycosyltransferase